MASLRRKYQTQLAAKDESPVASTPVQAAEPPPAAAAAKPVEPITTESPADVAARSAIKQRLQEMENAEGIAREAVHQQRLAEAPPQQDPLEQFLASVPEAAANWLRDHPEYMNDPRKNAALQHYHWIAKDEAGEEFTPKYIECLEHHLGMRQQPPPQPNGAQRPAQSAPVSAHAPAPRASAPARQYAGPPVSAPPTRESPSMTTGRPLSRPAPLTREEVEIALQSKLTPGESDEAAIQRYTDYRRRMQAMKQSGQIQ
jgi:hypothetical protein